MVGGISTCEATFSRQQSIKIWDVGQGTMWTIVLICVFCCSQSESEPLRCPECDLSPLVNLKWLSPKKLQCRKSNLWDVSYGAVRSKIVKLVHQHMHAWDRIIWQNKPSTNPLSISPSHLDTGVAQQIGQFAAKTIHGEYKSRRIHLRLVAMSAMMGGISTCNATFSSQHAWHLKKTCLCVNMHRILWFVCNFVHYAS